MLNRRVRNLALTALTFLSATALTALGAAGASAAPVAAANPGHAQTAATGAALAAPAAAHASAIPDTTNVLCAASGSILPKACVQVFGSGVNISSLNGWAYKPNSPLYTGDSAHIELYYMTPHNFAVSTGSFGGGDPELAPSIPVPNGHGGNCPEYNLQSGANSNPCSWDPAELGENPVVNAGYYCSAVWVYFEPGSAEPWLLASYRCADVHL